MMQMCLLSSPSLTSTAPGRAMDVSIHPSRASRHSGLILRNVGHFSYQLYMFCRARVFPWATSWAKCSWRTSRSLGKASVSRSSFWRSPGVSTAICGSILAITSKRIRTSSRSAMASSPKQSHSYTSFCRTPRAETTYPTSRHTWAMGAETVSLSMITCRLALSSDTTGAITPHWPCSSFTWSPGLKACQDTAPLTTRIVATGAVHSPLTRRNTTCRATASRKGAEHRDRKGNWEAISVEWRSSCIILSHWSGNILQSISKQLWWYTATITAEIARTVQGRVAFLSRKVRSPTTLPCVHSLIVAPCCMVARPAWITTRVLARSPRRTISSPGKKSLVSLVFHSWLRNSSDAELMLCTFSRCVGNCPGGRWTAAPHPATSAASASCHFSALSKVSRRKTNASTTSAAM
mmetsp:Transcript_44014/g.116388  ORF Transcript_44014/g.116388 Transcript_44014/m.116388 type:complete len:407 (+) Transcript_44014:2133-3353(+)